MSDSQTVSTAVAKLYDTYPFPPEPLLDEPPPGYNWRWNWLAAYNFCTGQKPQKQDIRILDAGCGTGVGTEYLVHLNPHASVVGIDLSAGALDVARERCKRSGANRVEFHHLSLYDVAQLSGEFDLINCVGVLHHLDDPIRGIQVLASKLAPGGLMHIFVYGELGRWEIQLMQKAIALIQGEKRGDYRDGVQVGRQIFASLPENNRIVKRERERWSLENQRDECFADMYVHPQEIDYNIDTLFELIDASGLEFIGFSNPGFWQLERLLGKAPELMVRAGELSDRQRYRLIELLDPEVTHYEFFLGRLPITKADWSNDDALMAAIAERNPCIDGFPSQCVFNYDYQIVHLSESELKFLQACEGKKTVAEILRDDVVVQLELKQVRSLINQQLVMLTPS
ncbi:class I SAM-dependent methyltransferase [Fischerella thermalis]|jgi:SAM-dependent methyltransferase|uniref:class I SAM-dependent methyltransferase n=1 Tax=Fischerella thermalis TaxID=372787 RepID=UPI0003095BCC|nr:class I SAM-dependent methyltransferase [Fischerella thermalis]PMB07186.1 SAM-dependent methyltransferase [Fischerella thermalis CCMEE 5273]PMB11144.1 SAM-dependent methyltransferase [Fischerella thermalis CCMEE 5328]PLZ04619.1 SAM-dependent methyltransferase [Fischerella thermalis WC119]PLZ05765.1 SAM-dependent methyltransferase [Fischerella thermalis WC1110]PLZ05807.1 SAM-dependent methyltransferase [Fischerella thermalis WC114]